MNSFREKKNILFFLNLFENEAVCNTSVNLKFVADNRAVCVKLLAFFFRISTYFIYVEIIKGLAKIVPFVQNAFP